MTEIIITEDFVTKPLALELKRRGFNGICQFFYTDNDGRIKADNCKNSQFNSNTDCACPTVQMAVKWLRLIHHIRVETYKMFSGYNYQLYSEDTTGLMFDCEDEGKVFNSDEEAACAGIWKAFELIDKK